MIKERNLDPSLKALLKDAPVMMPAEKHYVCGSSGQAYTYWRERVKGDRISTSLATQYAKTTSGRNDVIFLSPDSHSLATSLTWSNNLTHLVGMGGVGMMNQRARIGASAAMTPMIDVTGYGNTFMNIYNQWGYADASSTFGIRITGNRNNFYNVHFAGPLSSTIANTAYNACCNVYGAEECYFNGCTFGTDTIERGADVVSLLLDGAGGSDVAMRHIFDDCLFLASSDSGSDAHWIHATAATHGWALFRNCTFINISSGGFDNAMALGLSSANGTDFRMLFSGTNNFHGCTDIIANGEEAKVELGTVPYIAAATSNGLMANPDHT